MPYEICRTGVRILSNISCLRQPQSLSPVSTTFRNLFWDVFHPFFSPFLEMRFLILILPIRLWSFRLWRTLVFSFSFFRPLSMKETTWRLASSSISSVSRSYSCVSRYCFRDLILLLTTRIRSLTSSFSALLMIFLAFLNGHRTLRLHGVRPLSLHRWVNVRCCLWRTSFFSVLSRSRIRFTACWP